MFEYKVKNGKVIFSKDGACYFSVPLEKFDDFFITAIAAYKEVLKENEKKFLTKA